MISLSIWQLILEFNLLNMLDVSNKQQMTEIILAFKMVSLVGGGGGGEQLADV
jgi:hypothetical protein